MNLSRMGLQLSAHKRILQGARLVQSKLDSGLIGRVPPEPKYLRALGEQCDAPGMAGKTGGREERISFGIERACFVRGLVRPFP